MGLGVAQWVVMGLGGRIRRRARTVRIVGRIRYRGDVGAQGVRRANFRAFPPSHALLTRTPNVTSTPSGMCKDLSWGGIACPDFVRRVQKGGVCMCIDQDVLGPTVELVLPVLQASSPGSLNAFSHPCQPLGLPGIPGSFSDHACWARNQVLPLPSPPPATTVGTAQANCFFFACWRLFHLNESPMQPNAIKPTK